MTQAADVDDLSLIGIFKDEKITQKFFFKSSDVHISYNANNIVLTTKVHFCLYMENT